MENASKALIMAAEILLGVLLLTLMVLAFRAFGAFSETVDTNIQKKLVSEFNVDFEKYRGETTITAQDVISIANLAKEYSKSGYDVIVSVLSVESKYKNPYLLKDEDTYKFIQQYSYDSTTNDIIYFECQSIEYDEETGRVNKIVIKKL
jgi:hypothetical protein